MTELRSFVADDQKLWVYHIEDFGVLQLIHCGPDRRPDPENPDIQIFEAWKGTSLYQHGFSND